MTTHVPCSDFPGAIARAADGSLDEASRQALDRHLADCPACRDALAEQRLIHDALAAEPETRASVGFHDRVMAEVERRASWAFQGNWRRWTWGLAPIAAALLIATAVFVSRQNSELTARTGSTTTASQIAVSDALGSASVSDSSMLSLLLTAHADDTLASHLQDKQP